MAEGRSYGDLLREARERRGIDLVSMARALHIRPDIVGAIESADFRKMPAHGYSKNMVRAYARSVGLDDARISQMYADERNAFEGTSQTLPERRRSSSSSRSESRSVRLDSPSRRVDRSSSIQRETARSRSLERTRDAGSSRRSSRGASSEGTQGRMAGIVGSLGRRSPHEGSRVHASFTQGAARSSLPGSLSRGQSGHGMRLPALNLPVILAIVAVIAIIAAVILFNGGGKSVDDVPDIPISGLTDTSATNESAQAPALEAAPSSAVFSFSVKDGQEAWITVNLDGSSTPVYAAVAEGPTTEDFEVTGTLKFETANIAAVTLTVDGEEVQATPSSSGGTYVYTVDFPSILAEWERDHGASGSSSASNSSSASSRAASSASSSSTQSSSSSSTSASSS